MSNEISEVTRRAIIDFLTTSRVNWAGRLAEDDFLARLYDLAAMPSTDHRMRNAAGDIRQHRINWQDWERDWVLYDSRFNLLRAPDDEFLRFLCEDESAISRIRLERVAMSVVITPTILPYQVLDVVGDETGLLEK